MLVKGTTDVLWHIKYDRWLSNELLSPHPPPLMTSNINVSSYKYGKYHCGDETILLPSYLHIGIFLDW